MTLIFLPAMYAIWFRIRPQPPADAVQQTALHPQGNSTLPDLADKRGQARSRAASGG
jgi:hypothetical protein